MVRTFFISLSLVCVCAASVSLAQTTAPTPTTGGINCNNILDAASLLAYGSSIFGVDCEGSIESATQACNSSGQMDPSAMGAMAGGMMPGQQQQGGPMGIAQACQSQAGMHKMAMMMNMAFQSSCSAAVSQCKSSCSVDTNQINDAISRGTIDATCGMRMRTAFKSQAKKCEALDVKSGQATTQMMMSAMQAQLAEQCVAQAVAQNTELVAACKSNPRLPECANVYVDCTNPDMARTHPKCICQDPTMAATHPVCSPNGQVGLPPGTQSGDFASTAADGRGTRRLSPTDLENILGGDPGIQAVEGQDQASLGAGGGPGGGSSGGPKANFGRGGEQRQGRYQDPFNTDILKGTTSSKGGGLMPTGGGGGGGFDFAMKKEENKNDDLDLRQFIPRENPMGMRGIATVARQDGVTGAMGPSIWEKLSRRYKKVQPFLEP